MDNNIVNSPVPEPASPEADRRERHQRKCSVCRHPEREAIEEAFLHWQSPNEIATQHDFEDPSAIYRHAHATGLFARRDNNLRFALGNFIERVNEIQIVTPGAMVQAIRAYTRITKTGQWVEPPLQLVVTHVRPSEGPLSHVPGEVAGQVRAAQSSPSQEEIKQMTSPKAIKALRARLRDVASGRVKRA